MRWTMARKLTTLVLLLATFSFILSLTSSIEAASIKDRMAARIPAINSLKDQGVIGENNKGFLEYRTGAKPQQQLVNDENKDRAAVYEAIARQEGVSAVLVGQRRAKMIAEIGKPGQWFQKPDGSWYKK